MRQTIGKIVLLILCIILLVGFVYFDSKDELDNTELELSFYLDKEIINTWDNGQIQYLFLPAYAELDRVELSPFSEEFRVLGKDILIGRGSSLAQVSFNEKLLCECIKTKEQFTLCIMKSENLPAIFMETDSDGVEKIWADKDHQENGTIGVYSHKGEYLYADGLKGIKSRGNYSFSTYGKKPFAITMKEEVSLLGLGKGIKYVLISNASDPTLIRNDIARRLDAALQTEHSDVGVFVDLYVNGEYLGNYYLSEIIEAGEQRVPIIDLETKMDQLYQNSNYDSFDPYETNTKRAKQMNYNPKDITGGYIVEREFEDRYRLEYLDIPSSFKTDAGEHFMVKSPKYCSDEQITYLQKYFNEAEEAIFAEDGIHPETKKSYDEYIDKDSFVKKYLVEEVTKNYDGGVSSVYMYKDSDSVDGRIKTAAIWDCDMSLGNYLEWMEDFSADPTGISKLAYHAHGSFWYDALYDKEDFYNKVVEEYNSFVTPYLDELLEKGIEEYRIKLEASAAMNEIRWKEDFDNNQYFQDRDTSFDELLWFIAERKKYLDSVWK